MSVLRLGVIGCGRIVRLVHLGILMQLPGVELVALAEADPRRREEASRRAPAAVAVSEYGELLRMPGVEAVVICLPNALHADATVAALELGKHVYLEKPLATTLDDGRRVVAAWRRAGVVGMIGFNRRFDARYQAARRHLVSWRLGELVTARSVFSAAWRGAPEWKLTRQTGGGVLLDLASHHVDLVHFLFGQEVREVFASLRSSRGEGDSATLTLRLDDGLLIQSFFSFTAVDEDRFEIYGRSGKLTVDRYRSLDVEITDPALKLSRLRWLGHGLRSLVRSPYLLDKMLAPSREPSYRAALAEFASAVRANRHVKPDLWDGHRSLAVIEAAEESSRTGKIVSLPTAPEENFVRWR